MNECELQDLGFSGDIFTWRNNSHHAGGYIRERLDRAVANEEWQQRFPHVQVHNGDPWHSDHRPLIISLDNDGPKNLGGQPGGFKFEAAWLEEESWKEVIKDAWEGAATHGNVPLADLLKTVAGDLQL